MKISLLTALFGLLFLTSCKKDCTCPQKTEKKIVLQPGPSDANSVYVGYLGSDPAWANGNNNSNNPNTHNELPVVAWTFEGSPSLTRSYLSFDLTKIPSTAEIVSAKLSLYGVTSSAVSPQGNQGQNNFLIQRVTENWDQTTITWNTQPQVTSEEQIEVPASTSVFGYDVKDIDVTALVKAMKNLTPNKTAGFCLRFADETPYKSIVFGSSKNDDASKRPKLDIVYKN